VGEEGDNASPVRVSAGSRSGVLTPHLENDYVAAAAAAAVENGYEASAGPEAGVLTPRGENGYEASPAGAGPGADV
jgi:hypothetical protein